MHLKIVVFIILALCSLNGYSQFSIAGEPGPIYVDIVPDTSLITFHNGPEKVFYIDADQNGQSDIKVRVYDSGGMGGYSYGVSVSAQHSSASLAFGHKDSSFNNYMGWWMVGSTLKMYSYGDTISESGFIPTASSSLTYFYYMTGASVGSHEWANDSDQFIGFRLTNTNGEEAFGYITVNCGSTSGHVIIKEYSLGAFVSVGFSKLNQNADLVIYPNPASDKLNISTEQEKIKILLNDLNSREIKFTSLKKEGAIEINVSALSDGIYFLSIQSKDKLLNKKIIIQH